MSGVEQVPGWAIERAQILTIRDCIPGEYYTHGVARAFARYIAAHEEAPVDPLLIEAREIAAMAAERDGGKRIATSPEAYRSGERDDEPGVLDVIEGIKRGIELAKTGGAA